MNSAFNYLSGNAQTMYSNFNPTIYTMVYVPNLDLAAAQSFAFSWDCYATVQFRTSRMRSLDCLPVTPPKKRVSRLMYDGII